MKLTVSFDMGDNVSVVHDFEFPDGTFVKGMAVSMEAGPVMRMPFYMHGERLHTICARRSGDEVASVDWTEVRDEMGPEPCQPIGCDNGYHLPGCPFAETDRIAEKDDPTTDVIQEVIW